MNDRFKFRVWHTPWDETEQPKMLYNAESAYDYMGDVPSSSFGSVLDDESFEVMQCTGLKDKNGKLIYEGDIVERDHIQGKKQGVVVFDKEALQFKATNMSLYSFVHRAEVIGNIYEDSHLIENSNNLC
jgi:uncharacterized phage protein (TIGR01671 family)